MKPNNISDCLEEFDKTFILPPPMYLTGSDFVKYKGHIRAFIKSSLESLLEDAPIEKSEHNDWCESLENHDMPCDCGVAQYNLHVQLLEDWKNNKLK